MRALSVYLVAIAITVAMLTSCLHEADLSAVPEVSFSNDVLRIMNANCNFEACHGDGGEQGPLTNYTAVMETGSVKAGDARGSQLYRSMTARGTEPMPPSGYSDVTNKDLQLIYIWIEQGAKNN